MKRIFLITYILVVALQLNAQLFYDELDIIVPFSLTDKYKNIIKTDGIHSLVLPSLNNDSLCRIKNNGKGLNELGNNFAAGFPIDSFINFKQNAEFFELEDGNLWVYTIESPTANGLGIFIKDFDVLPGCYFSVIPGFYPYEFEEPETYIQGDIPERILERGLHESVDNVKMVLEYFEPKGTIQSRDYFINSITYFYAGGFGQALIKSKEEEKKEVADSLKLKSGYYEDPNNPPLPCQKDVVCPEVGDWGSEAKSVAYIRIRYQYNGETFWSSGTCFFLNKAGGYSETENPIIVTCGHLFAPKIASDTYLDISNNHEKIEIIIDYEHQACNETKVRYGKQLPGSFAQIMLGSSFNPGVGTYRENDDYAVLQPSRNVKKLANFKILYAGWTSNPNYMENGYAAIGHPKNTVKKVNVENSRAWAGTNSFGLYFDLGVAEGGFSGSPIFNSSKNVVGWLCKGNGDCNTIGQENSSNHTTCGRFNNLYFDLTPYIDISVVGQATSSNPQPPQPSELPSHCRDCIQNGDETDIDCGGSCFPCGIQDVVRLKSLKDIPGKVKSRYEILAQPDPNTLLTLKGGNYSFEAGMNVYLKGGFEIEKGAVFYAGINAGLMSEADRGCGGICVYAPSIPITPNGDGLNDYWGFSQAFAVKYSIEVKDRWNHTIYTAVNQAIHENGWVLAWDGSGATQNTGYGILLLLTDCFGNTHTMHYVVNIYGLKSAGINENHNIEIESTDIDNSETKIKFYPNPFNDKVTLSYSGEIFPIVCKVSDINGKVVFDRKLSSAYEIIDLAGFASGTYIIQAKAGQYNKMEKLIKK